MKRKLAVAFVIVLASLIMATPVLSGCSTASPATKEALRIGVLTPRTGFLAVTGPPLELGAQLAVEDINKAGGILGRPVEIIIRDDKSVPDVATAEATDLYLRGGAQAIIGTVSDASAMALSAWGKDKKVLVFLPTIFSSAVSAEKGHRYAFFSYPTSYAVAKVMAIEAAKMPWNKIYNLHIDYELGHAMHNDFWKNIGKLKPGVRNVGEMWVGMGETEFSPIISAALASGADAIYTTMSGGPLIAFMAQARRFGLFEKMAGFGTFLSNVGFAGALGKNWPEGLYSTDVSPWYVDSPLLKRFDAASMEKLGVHASGIINHTYLAFQSVFKAMEKAKTTTDMEKVIDALEGLNLEGTAVGKLTIRQFDHRLNNPVFWVKTKFLPQYPNIIGAEVLAKYQDEVYETKAEVLALRQKK